MGFINSNAFFDFQISNWNSMSIHTFWQTHKSTLMVLLSAYLFSSSDLYQNIHHLVLSINFGFTFLTNLIIICVITALFFISLILNLFYEKSQCLIEAISLIGLPWMIHWTFIQIQTSTENMHSLVLVCLGCSIVLSVLTCVVRNKLPIIYKENSQNLSEIHSFSKLLELARLWICCLSSVWIKGVEFLGILGFFNFIVTAYKIRNLTYLSPKNQIAYLLMEIWTWVSFIIFVLRQLLITTDDVQPLYLFILLVFFLSLVPNSKIVCLFQAKILWNLSLYRKNNEVKLSKIISVIYATYIYNQIDYLHDPVISKFSPQFKYCILSMINSRQQFSPNSPSTEKYLNRQYSEKDEKTKFKDLLLDFIDRHRIIQENNQKNQPKLNIIICKRLSELNFLTFRQIKALYFARESHLEGNKTIKKHIFSILRKIFEKQMTLMPQVGKFPLDEFIRHEKIEALLCEFILNEQLWISRDRHNIEKENILKSLEKKSIIKEKLKNEINLLKVKGFNKISEDQLIYLIEKHVDSNPFLAVNNLMEKIKKRRLDEKSRAILISMSSQQSGVFVCNSLICGNMIIHSNTQFKRAVEYQGIQPISIQDIIPTCLKQLHEKALLDSAQQIYQHNEGPYFVQTLQSFKVIECNLKIQYYTATNQLNFIGFLKQIFSGQNIKQFYVRPSLINKSGHKTVNDCECRSILGIQVMIKRGEWAGEKEKGIVKQTIKEEVDSENQMRGARNLQMMEIQKSKNKINPLKSELSQKGVLFLLFIGIIISLFFFSQTQKISMINSIQTMNQLQNSIYRFSMNTQIYLPLLLTRAKLSSIYDSPQQYIQVQADLNRKISHLSANSSQILSGIKIDISEEAIINDLFQSFSNYDSFFSIQSRDFLMKMFTGFQIKFSSLIQAISNKNEQFQKIYLQSSLVFMHFILSNDFFTNSSQNYTNKIERDAYISKMCLHCAICLLIVLILLYSVFSVLLARKLRSFYEKVELGEQEITFIRMNIQELKHQMVKLKSNNSHVSIETKVHENILIQSSTQLFSHSDYPPLKKCDRRYTFIPGFIMLLCLFFSLAIKITIFPLTDIIQMYNVKFQSKLELSRFIVSISHELEDIMLEIIKKEQMFVDSYESSLVEQKIHQEFENVRTKNIIDILYKFTMDYEKVHDNIFENPCNFWIDCSLMQQIYGTKPESLIFLKNKMVIYIKQLKTKIQSNSTYCISRLHSSVQLLGSLKQIQKLFYIYNEILKKDPEFTEIYVSNSVIQQLVMLLLVLVSFLFCLFNYIKIILLYEKYRKQIYSLLPISYLLKCPRLSTQIYRYIFSNS